MSDEENEDLHDGVGNSNSGDGLDVDHHDF
jgi:hypothetical protein